MAEERLLRVNGVDLGVTETGSGPPLLLIPGGGGCSDYMEPVAQQIDGFATAYRVEPRGCGRSTHDGNYDLATTLGDFEGLRRLLGIERWIMGGHSHGAFLALAYALQHPERASAVLYIAGAGLQNDRSWHAAYHAGREAGADREVPAGTYRWNADCNEVANADYKRYVRRRNLWSDVANLQAPFRAVHGELDVRPVWPVAQLTALVPDGRLQIVPGAPHDLWYTHPRQLGAVLRDYLAELGSR
ncbi:alpha/beta fold hydrolase [Tenggerimyces flavus]|uniref:Alpha/beta fold hydrolase n=1 Tax=Tenggerimyces flavus TaxID=1708749 RepID=A0ABV7Y8D8_9ACTN|nr:alpha/beta hydrolase [Tenggerimyces flavus]MBM7783577.1 proline iminopeptidase [Tenggerimyces flavus]